MSVCVCGIELRVAFSMFDKDGDGHITVQEVHDTLASLGFTVEPARVKLMVKHVDTDGTSVATTTTSVLTSFR